MNKLKQITVCICTYKRPDLLWVLLNKLADQNTEGMLEFSVVVADNDSAESAREVVQAFSARFPIQTSYCVEPRRNIALARNKALANAEGDFIAFIDDDEYPTTNWLRSLLTACVVSSADGVLGPVEPYFEVEPPNWVTMGRFFERPNHESGYRISAAEARTGNVLIKRHILEGLSEVFRSEFGTGGEDVDFFRRMMGQGRVFVWCAEAVVYEAVPPARCKRSYLLKRALLRGKNSFKQEGISIPKFSKSLVAIVVYGMVLPFFLIAGDHYFMKYMIKFCDHAGKILGALGLNPINVRAS